MQQHQLSFQWPFLPQVPIQLSWQANYWNIFKQLLWGVWIGTTVWEVNLAIYIKTEKCRNLLSRNSTSRNSTYRYTYLCTDRRICKTGYRSLICESKEEGVPGWRSWLSGWLLVLAQVVVSWALHQALRPARSLLKIVSLLHSALPSLSCPLSKIN